MICSHSSGLHTEASQRSSCTLISDSSGLSPSGASVSQFSRSVMSDSSQPHELLHTRPPCPSPTPGVHPNSCPSSQWCHPAISSSVVPFSSCPQPLPASESFPMSQLFAWGGQSTGVSALASVLPMNTQDWSPLEWTGWISLQSGASVSSNLGKMIIVAPNIAYNYWKLNQYWTKEANVPNRLGHLDASFSTAVNNTVNTCPCKTNKTSITNPQTNNPSTFSEEDSYNNSGHQYIEMPFLYHHPMRSYPSGIEPWISSPSSTPTNLPRTVSVSLCFPRGNHSSHFFIHLLSWFTHREQELRSFPWAEGGRERRYYQILVIFYFCFSPRHKYLAMIFANF